MIYVMKSAFKDRLCMNSLEVATKVLSSLGLNDVGTGARFVSFECIKK